MNITYLYRDSGGIISKNRVSGSLAVTRALGDLALKKEVSKYTCYKI